ncbi:MAG: amino acid permease [Ktedonobacterales bacterium]
MAQGIETATQSASHPEPSRGEHGDNRLGAFLCWAVVFADIGTSVYYVPGILYGQVQDLAGFFVTLTLGVFVLLALKYAEVTVRFPEGGGVVTVAARGLNPWFGAVGGMFILVDYFLTCAISSLSGVQYFETLVPGLSPPLIQLAITLVLVALLGVLNWWGIKESAGVSAVIAVAAFVCDMLILGLIALKVPPAVVGQVFQLIFKGENLTVPVFVTGFAGAFLAFSGLESISQLSPVMRTPRHKTVTVALSLVVITVGITSPLLTIFSTILLTHPELVQQTSLYSVPVVFQDLQHHPSALTTLENQFISQLGYLAGGRLLLVLTAVTASTLLVFASNTAIIGAYHVFLALSRMQFFPKAVERMSKRRGTPYISILLATGIPAAVLVAVGGNITILGDMYAFGLLGAFSLTCISLDVIRWRERRDSTPFVADEHEPDVETLVGSSRIASLILERFDPETAAHLRALQQRFAGGLSAIAAQTSLVRTAFSRLWPSVKFYLGIFTTVLVVGAWGVNLVSKPLATAFGGTLTVIGVGISVVHYNRQRSIGEAPPLLSALRRIPHSVLVVLTSEAEHNLEVARAAIESAAGRPLVFLYIAQPTQRTVRLLQFNDPYLYDEEARATLAKVAALCARARVQAQFSYRVGDVATIVPEVWRRLRPEEIIAEAPKAKSFSKQISPEYVRFQQMDGTRVAHFVPRAQASEVATEPRITPRPRAAVSATEGTANGARGVAPAESGVTSSSERPAPNGHRAGGIAGPVSPGGLKNGSRTTPTTPSPLEGEKGGSGGTSSGGEAAGKQEETTASSRASDKLGVDISDYVWVGTRLVRKDELERESQENGTSTGEDAPSQSNQSK